MKKIGKILLGLAFLSLALSGCDQSSGGGSNPGHTHSFEDKWTYDDSTHWHKCTGCTEVSDKAAHTFVDNVVTPTYTEKGYTEHTCSVCKYSYKDNETGPLQPSGDDEITTYTFNSKSWGATPSDWTSVKDGSAYDSSKNGVQVTKTTSGAGAISPDTFDAVKEVTVKYCTNSRDGAGTIDLFVGSEKIGSKEVTKDGGTTLRDLEFVLEATYSGEVKIVVNCSKNSIYVNSVSIVSGERVPVDPTSISIGEDFSLVAGKTKQLSVTYLPKNANQNKEVNWSSSNSDVATVDNNGLVSVKETAQVGGTAVITATLKSNENVKASVTVTVIEQALDSYTLLMYVCGSDLESYQDGRTISGLATQDIKEILSVKNQPEDVNIVIETGGASKWASTYNISNSKLQRHHVENGKLITDDSLTNASMGKASTLQSFLEYGLSTYPAEKTALILWNHGGALGGVCSDENYNGDALTASEVKSAIEGAFTTAGLTVGQDKLEWIGYDACLMAVQDIAEINSKYFNYMICSEESEAGEGWEYSSWIDDLYAGKDTETMLKAICDGFIKAYDDNYGRYYDNDQTLSFLNLNKMAAYKEAFESLASDMTSTIKSNASTFNTVMKSVKDYGSEYCDRETMQSYISDYGYTSDMFEEVKVDGQTYYLLHGYYDFGTFDVKDALTKLKANSKFSSFATKIDNVLNLLQELVVYSKTGDAAGESYGLCLVCPMDSYFKYNSSETNFSNWRNAVTSRSL